MPGPRTDRLPWWRAGIIYQIYPRSWQDSTGDGVGDIKGITSKLSYLAWLGVDAIWLNPIMPSPNHDWGYDVSDYTAVHPELGTLADLSALIAEAATLGIRVLLDLVPAHTSDAHAWFQESRRRRTSSADDFYVWADPGPGGGPPNNWRSHFGGPAWTFDESRGQYYMHNFSPHQPQLNWWNRAVWAEFDRIMKYWLDRGVAGFRIDVCHGLFHDKLLRNNPLAREHDSWKERELDQRFVYNMNRPEGHDVLRHWRELAESYSPPKLLFGETWVPSLSRLADYYGQDDELHIAWNLPFISSDFTASSLWSVISETLDTLPADAWPAWAISTHDSEGRAATRWCRGATDCKRAVLVMLLTLRGTPILYYGDELGMEEPDASLVGNWAARDRTDRMSGRDTSRTPMQWDDSSNGGFTSTGIDPWLPVGDVSCNVAAQAQEPKSSLTLCRDLLALRAARPEIADGDMRPLKECGGLLAWSRGSNTLVAVNLGLDERTLPAEGRVLLTASRSGEGVDVYAPRVPAGEAIILDVGEGGTSIYSVAG